jgi:hypothetical protein
MEKLPRCSHYCLTGHRRRVAQGNLTITCNIAPSLRLLVPSSLQLRRRSADMNHYHLRSKIPLEPVDHVVDPSDDSVTFLRSESGGTARLDVLR